MSSSALSIRELKQQAATEPGAMVVHSQLESSLKKTTKAGDPFYELKFADAGDVLILRVWSNSPMFPSCEQLQAKQFYEIAGEFGIGNDGKSIDARSWKARGLDEDETAQVLAGSDELRGKQDTDYQFIENAIGKIVDPRLKALCSRFLQTYGERMRRTAAARRNHHARRGGLVEHVAQMMRTAIQISEAYELLNRDLLVSGVLFHDVGKLWENAYAKNGFTMAYTEVSELIGHIPLGMEIVNKLWREIISDNNLADSWRDLEPHSEKVRLHLLHLIASHHGEIAFGSPVVPKTPEAQVLHYVDNIDAKMEMFEQRYVTSEKLAENIYKKEWPLEGNLVQPLPKYEGDEPEPEYVVVAETSSDSITAEGVQILPDEDPPADDGLPIPAPPDDVDPKPF